MKIPRGYKPGAEAQLLDQTQRSQGRQSAAGFQKAQGARSIGASASRGLMGIAQQEQEATNRANDIADAAALSMDMTQIEAEADAMQEEISPEFLAQHKAKVDKHISGLARNDEQRLRLQSAYDKGFEQLTAGVAAKNRNISENKARNNVLAAYRQAIESGDAASAAMIADIAEESKLFAPQAINSFKGNATQLKDENVASAAVDNIVDGFRESGDIEAAFAAVEKSANAANISDNAKDMIKSRGYAAISAERQRQNTVQAEINREQARERSELYSDLTLSAQYGYTDPNDPEGVPRYLTVAEAEAEYQQGNISPEQRTALVGQILQRETQKIVVNQAEEDFAYYTENNLVHGGGAAMQKVASAMFPVEHYAAYSSLASNERGAMLNSVGLNMVPSVVPTLLKTGMQTDNPEKLADALQLAIDLKDAAPNYYNGTMPAGQKAYYEQLIASADAGIPPATASSEYKEWQNAPQAQKDARASMYREDTSPQDNREAFDSFVNSDDGLAAEGFIWDSDPVIANTMYGQFEATTRKFYEQNGLDIDTARNAAWSVLRGTMGPSGINGETTAMKFPPELRPGTQTPIPTEFLQESLTSELGELLGDEYQPEKFNYRIISDARTSQAIIGSDGGKVRSYAIIREAIDPADAVPPVITDKNNIPLRWVPDYAGYDKKLLAQATEAQAAQQKTKEEIAAKAAKRDEDIAKFAERKAYIEDKIERGIPRTEADIRFMKQLDTEEESYEDLIRRMHPSVDEFR